MEKTVPELLNQIIDILSQPISISDIVSLVLASISVFAAIFVPYKIMEKQNKIAVFEKRFEIYCIIEKIINFSNAIENLKTLPDKQNPDEIELSYCNLQIWFSMFNKANSYEETIPKDFLSSVKTLDEILTIQSTLLKSTSFLFGKDVSQFVLELEQKYQSFIKNLSQNLLPHIKNNNYSLTKTDFISYVNGHPNYQKLFIKYLKLN